MAELRTAGIGCESGLSLFIESISHRYSMLDALDGSSSVLLVLAKCSIVFAENAEILC